MKSLNKHSRIKPKAIYKLIKEKIDPKLEIIIEKINLEYTIQLKNIYYQLKIMIKKK